MTSKIYVFSFALLLSSNALSGWAQKAEPDSSRLAPAPAAESQRVQGVQYSSRAEAAAAAEAEKAIPLFAGASVSFDVCGAVMAAFTPYGTYEAAARVNLRGRYFPIVELGIGTSNHTHETTELHYKVHAPYFRLGMDYNVMKNHRSGNRIFVGVRYGFSTYKYDIDGPNLTDAVYGTSLPFHYEGLRGTNHWGEALFGLEAKVWGILHLGWSIRYRMRIYNKKSALGNAWYIPGYGRNDTHALGGTFNVIFDI